MNHDIIKRVILEQRETINNLDLIGRNYYFELSLNYVLVGPRRAGKTMLLYSIVKKLIETGVDWNQIIFVNFEDERLVEFTALDFNDIVLVKNELTDAKGYYFFDEIQNIDGWERFARRMSDQKEFVYITGSNAKMLSREISNTLGGRYIPKMVSTFSFREYLSAKEIPHTENDLLSTSVKGRIIRSFEEYYTFGGFPETLSIKSKREYVSNVYQKIILGDVMSRNNIRNDTALRLMVKKIAESVCTELSYTPLHNMIKSIGASISKDTIIDYVEYMKDAYLLFSIKNYYAAFAGKESNPKYYFQDNGLLNLFLIDKKGSLLENAAAIFLHNKYHEDLFYLRSSQTSIDIDFFIPEENTAIQVAYSIEGDARKREIDNLLEFAENNTDAKLIILTYNEEELIETKGKIINVVPAYRFLVMDPE